MRYRGLLDPDLWQPARSSSGDTKRSGVGVSVRPEVNRPPITKEQDDANFEAAKSHAKSENPDGVVDEKATASSYSFGSAGGQALVTSFAYGVASSIVGLPDQAASIDALQQELKVLQGNLTTQLNSQVDAGTVVVRELGRHGDKIDALLGTDSHLPPIRAFDDILAVSGQGNVFATPNPVVANQLLIGPALTQLLDQGKGPRPVMKTPLRSRVASTLPPDAPGRPLAIPPLFLHGAGRMSIRCIIPMSSCWTRWQCVTSWPTVMGSK